MWVIAPAMCGDSKLLGHLRQRYGAEMRSRISRGGGGSAACFGLQAGVDCTLNDFRFMALARTLVVAEGSTFSFWAALLAANATQVHVINPLKDNPKGKFVAHDQRDAHGREVVGPRGGGIPGARRSSSAAGPWW